MPRLNIQRQANITAVVPNNKASAEGGSVDSEDLHIQIVVVVVGLDARGEISCTGDNYLILCSLLILEITRWRSKRLSVLLIKGGNAFDFSDNNAVKRLMGGS